MDVRQAARNTNIIWIKNSGGPTEPIQSKTGSGYNHVAWVLSQIESGEVQDDKAQRWLGWAQGFLCACGQITLDDCKYANVFA